MSEFHMRQQIRDATRDALLGTSFCGDDVFVGRVRPLGRDARCILVYTRSETSRRDTNGSPPIQERTVRLLIELRVATAAVPDDDLSDGQTEVEAKMAGMIVLAQRRIMGGLLRKLEYVGCEEVVEAVGDKHIGGLQLEYAATYRVPEGTPTAPV